MQRRGENDHADEAREQRRVRAKAARQQHADPRKGGVEEELGGHAPGRRVPEHRERHGRNPGLKAHQVEQPRCPVCLPDASQLPRLSTLDQVPRRVEQQAQHIDRVDARHAQALEPPEARIEACIADTGGEPAVVAVGEDEAAQHEEKGHPVLAADDALAQPRRHRPEQVAVVQDQHRERGHEAQAGQGRHRGSTNCGSRGSGSCSGSPP